MAAEVFRIEIPIDVQDNTDPGVSSAKNKVSAFDKVVEKTKKRLDNMNKTKWQVAIEAVDKVTNVVSNIGGTVKSVAGKAWNFTISAIDKVTAPVKKMISVLGDMLGISTAISGVLAGLTVKNALTASADMARMQAQLKVSADNMGIDEKGINTILNKATALSQTTMYTDEAMVGSAAELATYFDDVEAITRMMDTVADYAAGMSGGVELSTEEIVDYTTNLAKMTTGAYDAMTKKGFEVTDAQKKILESGTDMQKVAAIEEIIKENWEGMADAMASTPTGYLTRMTNAWDKISGTIGDKLTPGFTNLYKMIYSKMPGVEKILSRIADGAGSWIEDFVPTLESWIDKGISKLDEFVDRASDVFSSTEFKNADFFGKIQISWNKLIAEPFSDWWNSTGKTWFADKANSVGEVIGGGISTGLLALLGIDVSSAFSDGASVGGSFIDGFKKGFDTEKISEALKEWAKNNKEIVIGVGAVVGFNLITGIASKLNKLTSLFNKGSKGSGASGSSVTGNMVVKSTTTTVQGSVVNVYGAKINSGESNQTANFAKKYIASKALTDGGKTAVKYLTSKGSGDVAKNLLGKGTQEVGQRLLTSGAKAAGKEIIADHMVTLANGTPAATGGAFTTGLAHIGTALGSGATTGMGAVAAGAASSAGIVGGILGLGSSVIDLFQGIGKSKKGDKKGAKDEYFSAGSKAGMVGAGAGIGAAIGSVVPVIGTGVGAAVGAGIGGVAALTTGSKAGKALSDSTDKGGWLSNAWGSTKSFFKDDVGGFFKDTIPQGWDSLTDKMDVFFTETLPESWDNMWDDIGEFFKEDVPYAIGYACGKVETFFTEDVPQFFSDLWDDISTFFSDTLPTWADDTWNNHVVPFFTEDVPQFFTDLWDNLVTFFTDTVPTWAEDTWDNHIVPFFTEDVPQFFSDLWDGLVTFFTETIPTWASNIWNNHIVPFFTEKIPSFFTSLWDSVTTYVTEQIPTWASNIWSSISGWFSNIGDWFSNVWDSVKSSFNAGYSDATEGKGSKSVAEHAYGGIMTSPHLGMVAEAGPEAIIPTSPSKRSRGFDLWKKTGELLGVRPYEDGGIVGHVSSSSSNSFSDLFDDDTDDQSDMPSKVYSGESSNNNNFDVKVELNPEFVIEGKGMDESKVVSIIKDKIRDMVDDISDELAERLKPIFDNMPTKGKA